MDTRIKKGKVYEKVCTCCEWEGMGVFGKRKCPRCGNLNLVNKKNDRQKVSGKAVHKVSFKETS
jgi:phage FluMu protein Com